MNIRTNHQEYRDLLYAYSHDLLLDSDRERLELHLAECSECLERALHIEKSAQFLDNDTDALRLIEEIATDKSAEQPTKPRPTTTTKWNVFASPRRLTAAAAIILLALVLKPWEIQINPHDEVIAAENRLAVLHFDNLTDPTDSLSLGQSLANLLATDLSESLPMQVVSPQRVAAIYRLFEYRDLVLDEDDLMVEITQRAKAKYILSGAVVQIDSEYVLTAQLIDYTSEHVLMSVRVPGHANETIFPLIDKLTVHIREAMALPTPTVDAPDLCIADITTNSTKAYAHYIRGLDLAGRFYTPEAEREFEKALKYDSTFALAWYELSRTRGGRYLDQALVHADKVSRKERRLIMISKTIRQGNSDQAITDLRNLIHDHPDDIEALFKMSTLAYGAQKYDSAVSYFSRCIEIDSLYKRAYNSLAFSYDRIGDLDKAFELIDMYADLVPNEPNPLDSKGDIYARNGFLSEAIDAYRAALAINPLFFGSLLKSGHMWLFLDEPDSALAIYRKAVAHQLPGARAYGRLHSSYPLVMLGKFNDALSVLDDGIGADRIEGRTLELAYKHLVKASIYELLGQLPEALSEARQAIGIRQTLDSSALTSADLYVGLLLIQTDSIEQASQLAEQFAAQRHLSFNRNVNYQILKGELDLHRGELDSAVQWLKEAAAGTDQFHAHYRLGLAYLESGDFESAIAEFESQLRNFSWWRAQWSAWNLQMYYYLGVAYEESDRYTDAIKQYQTFLNENTDADPGFVLILETEKRLTRLKNSLQ